MPKNVSKTFNAVVDRKQRFRTQCNHTGTHLLHQALREVLGDHVQQKGSRVSSDHLRFDFSHFSQEVIEDLSGAVISVTVGFFLMKLWRKMFPENKNDVSTK